MDESFLTPALQARVGVPSEAVIFEVTPVLVARLRETLGSDHRGRVPPAVLWVPDAGREVSALPDLPASSLVTGDEWELRRPIQQGERLNAVNRLVDASERFGSRLGHTLALRHEWTFTDAAGEPVAFARRSMAYYRKEELPRRDEAPDHHPPREAAAPGEAAPSVDARLATPGDPLRSRLLTPTLTQVIRYIAVTWNFTEIFYDAEAARAAGLPGTLIPGPLKLGLLAEMALDWAGLAALLESIRVAHRRPDIPGRPLLLGGAVTQVEEASARRRLHCDLWIENADGERSAVGAAVLSLPRG